MVDGDLDDIEDKRKDNKDSSSNDNKDNDDLHAPSTASTTKGKKNPSVDTSFLPTKPATNKQPPNAFAWSKNGRTDKLVKQERLQITYSYWDGSGHRRECKCCKGDTIGDFLEQSAGFVWDRLKLNSVAADALLYVKEDLIIPQDLTFDLIATKARGKSGTAFHLMYDDVRVELLIQGLKR
jgi:protein FAM50